MDKYIWIKGKRYYYYDTFKTYQEAWKIARHFRKKNKSRFYIQVFEHGFVFPEKRYRLYMDKTFRLFGTLTVEK